MLDRLNTLRWCVCAVLSDPKITKRGDARHLELKDEQWKLIGDILPILNLLKIANTIFCGEKYCTISEVLYVLHKLKSKLQPSEDDDELHEVKILKEELVKNINIRFFDKLDVKNSVYVKAMALDPRFKKLLIFEPHEREQVYNEIEKELFEMQVRDANLVMETDLTQGHKDPRSSGSGSESDECKNSDSPLFGDDDLLNENSNTNITEFKSFLEKEAIGRTQNVLFWWKKHENVYSNVAKLAKYYLCIPAASVASERHFSAAGRHITKSRNRLKPSTNNTLLFVNANRNKYFQQQ